MFYVPLSVEWCLSDTVPLKILIFVGYCDMWWICDKDLCSTFKVTLQLGLWIVVQGEYVMKVYTFSKSDMSCRIKYCDM